MKKLREQFEAWAKGESSPLPSGNYTESEWQRLALAYQAGVESGKRIAEKEQGLGDPLYPFYEEYMSMVPPEGEPQMTYSGWLRNLAERLTRERNTPAMEIREVE